MRSCEHFWLAGNRQQPTSLSPFVWRLQGCDCDTAMGFSNWAPGQPDNGGNNSVVNEACLAMTNNVSSPWYDFDCDERTCAICEYLNEEMPMTMNWQLRDALQHGSAHHSGWRKTTEQLNTASQKSSHYILASFAKYSIIFKIASPWAIRYGSI